MDSVHARIREILLRDGIVIEGFYACPHAPEICNCDCRKPKPGLVNQAVHDHGFDPENAIVVGDKGLDIGLGKGVGAKTVLVRTGYGAKEELKPDVNPDLVIASIASLRPDSFVN